MKASLNEDGGGDMIPVEVKGLSEADADRLIAVLTAGGATDIEKTRAADGTFTVKFNEPDDSDDES
jgi:hypothetical protein